ncbi:MAG: hypothetical protein CBC91_06125 [Rickettsiales bacterium TMED131]|nr:MAG: hypothetical protein CBC91_06125 [Rickettsiales bacterium TMED131]
MSISLNTLETYGMSVKSILAEMEENFPPTNPGPSDSISTIMYRSGQRSVVEWLLNRLKQDGI